MTDSLWRKRQEPEALKLALEALVFAYQGQDKTGQVTEAIIAIKEALAQPEQKPMLLIQSHRDGFWCVDLTCKKCYGADFRFKHAPPQRKPLTDEEMKKIWYAMQNIIGWYSFQEIARAIEAAHGIKE